MLTPGAEPISPVVLDTSAYSRFRAGHPSVLSLLAHAPLVYLPVVVIGELEAGFSKGTRRAENAAALKEFIDEPFVEVFDVNRETARRYGGLLDELRRAGTPIPTNDVWIAAIASGTDGFLVTFDHDFDRVPGLRCMVLS